jgi:hypothetical protein|tara:strand:- start:15942 stop:17078 length:1137 start_codon:yes stop_codon:yes gene_type:complete
MKTIAFFFENNDTWVGEKNYLISLITSISKNKSISLKIFCSKKDIKFLKKKKISSKYIISSRFFDQKSSLNYLKKILSKIFGYYDPLIFYFVRKYKLDIISHFQPTRWCENIAWIPDLQHKTLKKNFTSVEKIRRDKLFNNYLVNSSSIITSSVDTKKKILKYYKFDKDKTPIHVLNFIPFVDFKKIKSLKKINNSYAYLPNQFWNHKNHIVVAKACKILKTRKIYIKFFLTGSRYNQKNTKQYDLFFKYVRKNELQNYFKYLGFVSHEKVINLVYNAQFLINPSYYEGWSTTVEEGKILSKQMILSNINVHLEQRPNKAIYFNPNKYQELSKKLIKLNKNKNKNKNININLDKLEKNYKKLRKSFSENYLKILNYND